MSLPTLAVSVAMSFILLLIGRYSSGFTQCSNWSVTMDSTSLEKTFSLLSGISPDSCNEVIVSEGRYKIQETVIVNRDLFLHGREGHTVIVEFETSSEDLQYCLSFRNTRQIHVSNINFLGSTNGNIGFDNVSTVEINNCSFR